ncbi:MAG: BamA/TamA family outer membrane protein [Nannocystaceae bacterium]
MLPLAILVVAATLRLAVSGPSPAPVTMRTLGAPPRADEVSLRETGGAPVLLRGTACELDDAADPLYAVAQALTALTSGHVSVSVCQLVSDPLQGRVLEARLEGHAQELAVYVLGNLATDGYAVELAPAGPNLVQLTARPSPRGRQGVLRYVGVDRVDLTGAFLPGDDAERVGRIIDLSQGNFFPDIVEGQLRALGYRAVFWPLHAGEVQIGVRPGRSLRRIRVHGSSPLAQREVRRQLSIDARPGALARGRCAHPRALRGASRPPICAAEDVSCREWERVEVRRLEQFLFDGGYMRGSASLGLSCGRAADEADLHIYLEKGPAHRIARRGATVTGVPAQDMGWLRREFMPRFLLVRRKRVTREFMETAEEKVRRTYAEPSGPRHLSRAATTIRPHPQVQVRTTYSGYHLGQRPPSQDLPLAIRVELGPAVEVSFTRPPEAKEDRPLSFTRRQLTRQLQLFKRRDRPSTASANREAANLRAFYQSKGYLLAQIDGFYEDFGTLQKLRFTIREGPKARIRGLELQSPGGVPPAVLERIERRWADRRRIRRRGSLSETDALADLGSLLAAYNSEGYLCARAQARIALWRDGLSTPRSHALLTPQTLAQGRPDATWLTQFDAPGIEAIYAERRVDLYVRFEVTAGPRVLTSRDEIIRYLDEPIGPSRSVLNAPASERGRWGARRILHGSPLRAPGSDQPGGIPVTLDTARDTARTVLSLYRDSGFPVADAEVTWRYRRRGAKAAIDLSELGQIADPNLGVCQGSPVGRPLSLTPVVHVFEGKPGKFGDILVRGNFKTRTWVIERELDFDPGDTYRKRYLDSSIAGIDALGVARSVGKREYPVNCRLDETGDCVVHELITIEEGEDRAADIKLGVGAMTLNPFYVFLRPALPNLWGTAWDLNTEGLWGFDLSETLEAAEVCGAGQSCYERGARASLTRPRFLGSIVDLELAGQYRRQATPARGRINSAVGSLRVSWRLGEHWSFYNGYLLQLANLSKEFVKPPSESGVVSREQAIVSDRTGLFETGAVLNRTDNAFNPREGFIVSAEAKFAFAAPYIGGHDWWTRADIKWQHFLPIPHTRERLSLRYSLAYGHAAPFPQLKTSSVPEIWRYFGGGTSDLGLRGILPETMLVDLEEVELAFGGRLYRPRAQGGHIRALGTVALQFVSLKDLAVGSLAHSLFYDFGVLTQKWSQVDLRRDYRHSVGINAVKLDMNLVTLALGYAILIPTTNNIGPTDDANGRIVFDVGITF